MSWRLATTGSVMLRFMFAIQDWSTGDAAKFAVSLERQRILWGVYLMLLLRVIV